MNSVQLCSLIDNKLSELTDIVSKYGVPKYSIEEFSLAANTMHLVILGDANKFQLVKRHIVYSRPAIIKLFKCRKFDNDKEKIYYITKLLLFLLISPIANVEQTKIEYYVYSYQYLVAKIISINSRLFESKLMDFNLLTHISSVNMSKLGLSKELINKIHEQIASLDELNNVKLINKSYYGYFDKVYSTTGVHQTMLNTDGTLITQVINYKNLSNLPDTLIDTKHIPLPGDTDQVIKIINGQSCYCIKVMTNDLSNYAFWNYGNLEYEFLGFTKFPMILKTTESIKDKVYSFKWNDEVFYSTWNGQVDPSNYTGNFPRTKTSGILVKNEGKCIKLYFHEYDNPTKGFAIDACDTLPAIEWLRQVRLFKSNKHIKKIILYLKHNSTYQSHMQDIIVYCRNNSINTSINLLI